MKVNHIPAVTLPEEIGRLMAAIRSYPHEVTRGALLACAYTAQRPGNVAAMRWDEVSIEAAEWRIPPEKMKTRHAHIVPLPKQMLAILEGMRAYTAGREYVFPPLARQQSPHLHRDALSKALRIMGFSGKHATHGFRGMLRTAGRERLGIDPDVLEAQLAHAKRGRVQQAYDRTRFDDARRIAMQRWADWLDSLATGEESPVVVPLARRAKKVEA
jgi:integrase